MGNCSCPEWCEYLEPDNLCLECSQWSIKEARIYQSNYEYRCDKCGQPINPRTDYHVRRRAVVWHGHRITEFYRTHVACPQKVEDRIEQQDEE